MTLPKYLILSITLLLCSFQHFTCLNAYVFKIFPVGIHNNQIISFDVKIQRVSILELENGDQLMAEMEENNNDYGFAGAPAWILKTHIVHYDFEQNPLKVIELDSIVLAGEDYSKTLQKLYTSAFNKIQNDYEGIDLFEIEYLSFCDYQKTCNQLSVTYDSIQKITYGIYDNQKYVLNVFDNERVFGLSEMDQEYSIGSGLINSVRVYKAQGEKLVLGHLQRGHEISMGWIKTSDYKKPDGETEEIIIIPKEEEFDLSKQPIAFSTYQEPLLHHGYGFDVFFMVED